MAFNPSYPTITILRIVRLESNNNTVLNIVNDKRKKPSKIFLTRPTRYRNVIVT